MRASQGLERTELVAKTGSQAKNSRAARVTMTWMEPHWQQTWPDGVWEVWVGLLKSFQSQTSILGIETKIKFQGRRKKEHSHWELGRPARGDGFSHTLCWIFFVFFSGSSRYKHSLYSHFIPEESEKYMEVPTVNGLILSGCLGPFPAPSSLSPWLRLDNFMQFLGL